MKKIFEDFQKMKLKDACKEIENMTYQYIDPETNNPTVVPAKHYEKFLNATVEQFLDQSLQTEMLNNVFKQLQFLESEYKKDLFRSLICIDLGLKPSDLAITEFIALDDTYNYLSERQEKEKKKFHFLSDDILEHFDVAKDDKELHKRFMGVDELDAEELEDEPDLSLS